MKSLFVRKKINTLLILSFLITSLLSLSSYTRHSSFGMDHDFKTQGRILHQYYRINWTGYGSMLFGYGSHWREKDTRALEKFDPASSFLEPAETPAERDTLWKRMGFWFVSADHPAPMRWIGVPSWLPVLFLLLLLIVVRHK